MKNLNTSDWIIIKITIKKKSIWQRLLPDDNWPELIVDAQEDRKVKHEIVQFLQASITWN